MDRYGNKAAQELIAQIKIIAPLMTINVVERAMQIHGAMGLSQDTFLPRAYSYARTIRLADGPDQVHMSQLGKRLVKRYTA
jgi:acyl-CoA dehydrogenase